MKNNKSVLYFLSSLIIVLIFGTSVNSLTSSSDPVKALQQSQFEEAEALSEQVLMNSSKNSRANVVAAITKYKRLMHDFSTDFRTIFAGMVREGITNKRYVRWSLEQTYERMEEVESHLSKASEDDQFYMNLSLAKWEVDWNRNGRIDERDKLLFQIEVDADGKMIPLNDPRRTPTFRFDVGDIYWAQAMISFQRSAIQLLLAYSFPGIADLEKAFEVDKKIVIKIKDPKKVLKAKEHFLKGLEYAAKTRIAYLNEKDDEREWVPNPTQKDHPLPLPVDKELYTTWKDINNDLKLLLEGEEGIDVTEVAQLGDNQWKNPPTGFINVGKLLENPGDITIDLKNTEGFSKNKSKENAEKILKDIFGTKYVKVMKKSKLISRFQRMKNEVDRGEESFERKLRYLFWLN